VTGVGRQAAIGSKLIAPVLLLAALVALVAYANLRRQVEVVFSVQSSAPGRLQIFHDADGNYSEGRSRWFELHGRRDRTLLISGREARRLRLDPALGVTTTVCDLRIGRSGSPAEYEILQVDESAVTRERTCMRAQPQATAQDPKLVVRFVGRSAQKIERAGAWQSVFQAALLGLLLVLGGLGYFHRSPLQSMIAAMRVPPGFALLDRRAHWWCAAMMLAFGTAYVFVTPPGAVPDEEAHLAKIVRISQGVAFGDSGSVPMPNPRQMYGPFSDYLINKAPFSGEQLRAQLRQPLACEATTTGLARGANGYFPHQYLLPSVLFKVGCASGVSFGWFLYASRMLNLLLAAALVAWGLAYAVRGKWALFLIALLPMSLFQMSSLSADSLALSLSIAWLGLVSGIAGGTLTPARATPVLWVLGLAIAFLKPGMAWVLASLLFCKPAYDAAGASFLAALGRHVALPWFLHVAWTLSATGDAPQLAGVDSAANIASLSAHPAGFVRTLWNTFFSEHGVVLLERMIGVLGWLDIKLSGWAYWTGTAALLAAFWTGDTSAPASPRYTAPLAVLIALGSLAVIALPLFIYWTSAGSPIVQGLQGRYFTVTAAFVLTWCSFRSPPAVRAMLVMAIACVVLAINMDALYRLYEAYFVIGRP